jgi:hypothetical protein
LENCLINTSYRLIVFPGPVRGYGQGLRSADGREQGRNKDVVRGMLGGECHDLICHDWQYQVI